MKWKRKDDVPLCLEFLLNEARTAGCTVECILRYPATMRGYHAYLYASDSQSGRYRPLWGGG
ncbi:hypothetical protein T06_2067, partial [Trichinella sp. T6]